MLSRLASVLLSLFLLGVVGVSFIAVLFKHPLVQPAIFFILLPVLAVVLWINWQAINRLSRYGGHPFQARRSFRLRLYEKTQAALRSIHIDGPALLIVTSDIPGTQIALSDVAPLSSIHKKFAHGQREVEFLVNHAGPWSVVLAVKAAKTPATSFRLLWGNEDQGVLTTLQLEVRGNCRTLELPENMDQASHGFPVVLTNPSPNQ
jgi:hypothetical protein